MRGQRGQHGQLVDEAGHFVRRDLHASTAPWRTTDAAIGSAVGARPLIDVDIRAHSAQHVDDRGSRRIQADAFDGHLEPAAPLRPPSRRPRRKCRRAPAARRHARADPRDGDGQPVAADVDTERFEAAFRMVTCLQCLGDARFAIRVQSGEQDRALDLSAWHLGLEVDGAQRGGALDRQRRTAVLLDAMRAPMRSSGTMMRRIGCGSATRRRRSRETNGWAARIPPASASSSPNSRRRACRPGREIRVARGR